MAFSVISAAEMITYPLFALPENIIGIIHSKSSLERIQEFLKLEEVSNKNAQNNDNTNTITIKNASYAWDRQPFLKDINLVVKKGELVVITGKIGSGKSSLLSALTGEMKLHDGHSSVSASCLAYLNQTPWLQNDTIRSNILFGAPMIEEKYKKVLFSCMLEEDLSNMKQGDLTVVGEHGAAVSGGQKARVALARALYHNNSLNDVLYLLDDPLSAVDVRTGNHLVENVVHGMLKDSTRILVTHHVKRVRNVDRVIVMSDGKIIKNGSYKDIIGECSSQQLSSNPPSISLEQTNLVASETITNESTVERQANKISVLFDFLLAYNKFVFFILILFIVSKDVSHMIGNWYLSRWGSDENFDGRSTQFYILMYLLCGVVTGACVFVVEILGIHYILETVRLYHDKLLNTVLKAQIKFFDANSSGSITSRFGRDLSLVEDGLSWQVRGVLSAVISISLWSLLIMWTASYGSSIILLCMVVPILYVYNHLSNYSRKASTELTRISATVNTPLIDHLSESLDGVSTIRAFGATHRFEKKCKDLLTTIFRVDGANSEASRWAYVRMEGLCHLITFSLMLISLWALPSMKKTVSGPILMSTFAVTLNRVMNITSSVSWLASLIGQIDSSLVGLERIEQFSSLKQENYDARAINDVKNTTDAIINFNQVFLQYKSDSPSYALNNVNFSIQKKEKIAIIGRTGSGKTSLINALFRLYDIESGSIIVRGRDVTNAQLSDLRQSISVIPQDPVLFKGTFRENVDPHCCYTDSEIIEAVNRVGLNKKVNNLHMTISQGGSNMSAGERQLISLCRAWLLKKDIMVLDEATANVDHETDGMIQETIRREFKQCTVLCVAHRLETIMDYDRIVVMSSGRIIQYDTPSNVMESGGLRIFLNTL
ncbi:ATP-binding cassette, subfamily C [Acrasis kona]|uniref:ATP-binding cassette, subfamily C n=1 Tax=Acrasis kona TaxID=1008807 RepID=A0AAW2ZGA9_9EUKA